MLIAAIAVLLQIGLFVPWLLPIVAPALVFLLSVRVQVPRVETTLLANCRKAAIRSIIANSSMMLVMISFFVVPSRFRLLFSGNFDWIDAQDWGQEAIFAMLGGAFIALVISTILTGFILLIWTRSGAK